MILRTAFIVMILMVVSSAATSQDITDAVWAGDIERVEELLEAGADVNQPYTNRFTLIYWAKTPEMVELLLAHGAKLDIRTAASIQSPIEHFAEKYFRDREHRDTWKRIIGMLREAGAEYTIDTAIYMNDVEFVQQELAKDASWVNKTRNAQSVALRLAARTGRVEICKLLLEHGADPDDFEQGAGYPIMVDAIDHPEVVALLIEHGANLRRRITWRGGRTGVWILGDEATALHFAIRAGNVESVKLLVAAGLDTSATDDNGYTPLHAAVLFSGLGYGRPVKTSSFVQIIEHLLQNDASLRLSDKQGRTPLQLAEEHKARIEIRNALQRRMG